MDSCTFSYPGAMDAQDAGIKIYQQLTGAVPRDVPCLAHCSWTLVGFGLSLGFPHPQPMYTGSKEDAEKALVAALKPLADAKAAGVAAAAIDWKGILRTALAWLVQLLS